LAGTCGLGGIERIGRDRIGKLGQRPAVVDLSLRPLGLQLAENADQSGDLLFIKIQLVSQEPQGAPDSEARPGLESVRVVMMGHETPSPLPVRLMSVGVVFVFVMMIFVFVPIGMMAGGRRSAMALVAPGGVTH